jgi:hypothetical protein
VKPADFDQAEREIKEKRARQLGRVFCAPCGDSSGHLASLWSTSAGTLWQVKNRFEHTDLEFEPAEAPDGFSVECRRHGWAKVTSELIATARDHAKGRPFRVVVQPKSTPLR